MKTTYLTKVAPQGGHPISRETEKWYWCIFNTDMLKSMLMLQAQNQIHAIIYTVKKNEVFKIWERRSLISSWYVVIKTCLVITGGTC